MTPPTQRCGLVAVLGAPNAGKSTLVNALVGQKVAIVSPKAQTTRARLMGIAIDGDTQMLLVDTPGIFTPHRRLDRAMVKAAWEGAEDADRLVLVIDAAAKVGPRVEQVLEGLEKRTEKLFLVLNKVDIAKKEDLLLFATQLSERLHPDEIFMVSATTGDGVADLKAALSGAMPESPWHFPDGPADRRHRPHGRDRADARAALPPAPRRSALFGRGRDREMGGSQGRLDRHPPADPDRARQPEGDHPRQGRRAPQADRLARRAKPSPSTSAARSTCSSTSRSTPSGTRTAASTRTSGWTGASEATTCSGEAGALAEWQSLNAPAFAERR